MAIAVTTRRVKKKIEHVTPGQDSIDLDPWFQKTFTSTWINKIADAYEQYSEDYWHDENNSACEQDDDDDDSECTCPQPDKGLVAAGIVYNHIVNEYCDVKSIEHNTVNNYVNVQIDFEDDLVPEGLTKFTIDLGTMVELNDFEEVPVQQMENEDNTGPLQPPKDFTKGLLVGSSKGPDNPFEF